jgi:hypothetical protein
MLPSVAFLEVPDLRKRRLYAEVIQVTVNAFDLLLSQKQKDQSVQFYSDVANGDLVTYLLALTKCEIDKGKGLFFLMHSFGCYQTCHNPRRAMLVF